MRLLTVASVLAITGCATPEPPSTRSDRGARERIAAEAGIVPACHLAVDCPALSIDPARCVGDGSWFDVILLDDKIEGASLAVSPLSTGLTPGRWYTIFAGSGGCSDVTVTAFEVPEVIE